MTATANTVELVGTGGKTAVIYLRVSSTGQLQTAHDPEGYSIPGQRDTCRRLADTLGATIIAEYVEPGRTGTNVRRPSLQQMLRELGELKPTFVIVYDLSRVARDDFDALWLLREIEAKGAKLESSLERIDDTPAGKLLYTIMAGVNAFRSRGDAEKVKMGLERKHQAGGSHGPARLGYLNVADQIDGRRVASIAIDSERAGLVRTAFELFALGDHTLTSLCTLLEDAGLRTRPTPTRASRPVSRTSLHRILRDDFYVGIVTRNGVKLRGLHQPLVDEDTFAQVQRVLDGNRASGDRSYKHSHYLSGSLYCVCGRRLGYGRHRSKSGVYYEYFSCLSRTRRGGRCEWSRHFAVDKVEWAVERRYSSEYFNAEQQEALRQELRSLVEPNVQTAKRESERHTRRLRELTGHQQKLIQLYYRNLVSEEALAAEQERIEQERTEARRWAEAAAHDGREVMEALDEALALVDAGRLPYSDASPQVRRLMNQAIFLRLIVFDPDTAGGERTALYEELHRLADDLAQPMAEGPQNAKNRPQTADSGSPQHGTGPDFRGRCSDIIQMAEREGFEPSIRLPVYTLSRRAPSTTRTPLHEPMTPVIVQGFCRRCQAW